MENNVIFIFFKNFITYRNILINSTLFIKIEGIKWNKNKNVLVGTYTKMSSSLSGKDVYDKKGNKIQDLYRKNDSNVHGEKLYDKNGNKLDGTYSQLNPDDDKNKKTHWNHLNNILKIIPTGVY